MKLEKAVKEIQEKDQLIQNFWKEIDEKEETVTK